MLSFGFAITFDAAVIFGAIGSRAKRPAGTAKRAAGKRRPGDLPGALPAPADLPGNQPRPICQARNRRPAVRVKLPAGDLRPAICGRRPA